MTGFDTIVVVDWSGGNDRGPAPKKDAIWAAVHRGGAGEAPVYLRNRQIAEAWLNACLDGERAAGRRVLAGFDFPFGYPAGVARAVTGAADPLALWDWLEERIEDAPGANNRWQVAAEINSLFPGTGPFWGNAGKADVAGLPRRGKAREGHGCAEFRAVETAARGAFPVWQLAGAGAVGSQVLTGLPVLARLRRRHGRALSVWPFEPPDGEIVLAEIWPSLIAAEVARQKEPDEFTDAAQVRVLAQALACLPPGDLDEMLREGDRVEGHILGAGHEAALIAAARAGAPGAPPPLRDDCFALPPGVDWTPVEVAMARLREVLRPVVGHETVPLEQAAGRVLAGDVTAARANPPAANSAVDGYGFSHPPAAGEGVHRLPLLDGRAAAGAPFAGAVPPGHALRILTGAVLPEGVDTVVLEEDCAIDARSIAFHGPLKRGANTRRAGEDVAAGGTILSAGHRLRPPDLALLAATGAGQVPVFRPLRVAVLSTGDELREPGEAAGPGQIYDANRPMLLALLRAWGHRTLDLGRIRDDPAAVHAALDAGSAADAVVTSGGASAGDEDHVSAILKAEGQLSSWRIALKPGRPLALAMWKGTPVVGLPGNPVAALVCALIFARPALECLSGAGWPEPLRVTVPAAFSKKKKPGRSEFLRARMTAAGTVEVFASEGSGRISGLTWAGGLVELGPEAQEIVPGTPVSFLPYAGFGL